MKIKEFYEISKPLILDGGMATELEITHGKKFSTNLWSASCLFQDPDAIKEVHLSYFRAGADIASTCSYQTPINTFIKEGFTNQEAIELIQKSVHIAVEARDIFWKEYQSKESNFESDRIKPMIALALGPFGGPLGDRSEYTGDYGDEVNLEKLKKFHKERLNIFKPLFSLIDFIAFETVPSYLEAESICSLLQEEKIEIPCWISFACKSNEEIAHGESFIECVQLCSKVECIVGVGVNCIKPEYVEKLVKSGREELDRIGQEKKYVICYPNDSIEKVSQEEFGDYTKIWAELAKFKVIIGGCCETTPDHIRYIGNALKKS